MRLDFKPVDQLTSWGDGDFDGDYIYYSSSSVELVPALVYSVLRFLR